MKPAPFDYHRAYSIDESVEMLAELGDDAKILAGGQSLAPMMNFRLARPSALIDINPVRGMDYITRDGDELVIGAMTRHRAIETTRSPDVLNGFGFYPRAARWIGHYPIRARGTVGGSIAHSDPTAELCLMAALNDADIVVKGPSGMRRIPHSRWFQGFMMNGAEPDEVVVETRFKNPRTHGALTEYARRRGDFAIVAAAVAFDVNAGRMTNVSVVLGGVDSTPLRLPDVESSAEGAEPSDDMFEEIAAAAAQACDPPTDMHGGPEYRRHLVRSMVHRALHEARQHGDGQ